MTITLSPSQLAWVNLPSEQKDMFNRIDGPADMDGYDWFEHLVPEPIQNQPDLVEVFMNGGTVTQDVWVHDQGMANGHYEQVSYEVADKDVSRITSGANGGEYTPDNTVMEDASTNRARGADNMTSDELDSINEANSIEADFIDGADVMVDGFETTASTSLDIAAEAGSVLDVAGDILSDIAAPAIGAYMAGTTVAKHMDSDQDKLGYGALAAGGGALLCMTPIGATGLAIYCGAKIGLRVGKWLAPKVQQAMS